MENNQIGRNEHKQPRTQYFLTLKIKTKRKYSTYKRNCTEINTKREILLFCVLLLKKQQKQKKKTTTTKTNQLRKREEFARGKGGLLNIFCRLNRLAGHINSRYL